jgi:hypothetical protein
MDLAGWRMMFPSATSARWHLGCFLWAELMKEKTLRELYCNTFNCAPEEFTERAFWQCLYPHGAGLARLIWLINRNRFRWDMELLKSAANSTDLLGLDAEIQYFRHRHRTIGFARNRLRVRVSGRALFEMAANLFRASSAGAALAAR